MFSGIVESTGLIRDIKSSRTSKQFVIESKKDMSRLAAGNSIAVDGVCLTVEKQRASRIFCVTAVAETLSKTTLGGYCAGDVVNLERAARWGDTIGGHIMQGHVDGTGKIRKIDRSEGILIDIEVPKAFAVYLIGRGSVALDGISLTIARVKKNIFSVAIIPFTWTHTNLETKKINDEVNIELDIVVKTFVHYMKQIRK